MADTMTLEGSRDYLLAMHGGYECASPEFCDNVYKRMADAIDATIKQREQDAKDAARYRWLREQHSMPIRSWHVRTPSNDVPEIEGLDGAIDAAMTQESGNG